MQRWVGLALTIALIGAGCTGTPPPTSGAFPKLWVMQGGWVRFVVSDDRRIARELLLRPPSVVLGPLGPIDGRPDHRTVTAYAWPSYHRFSKYVTGTPGFYRDVDTALYDPESWDATPAREQRHVVEAMTAFASLGHERGWQVIVTPHPSLTQVANAECPARPDESANEAFVRCDMMGAAARVADVVESQAQSLERDPDAYRAFVQTTAAQAHEAKPDVQVIVGLSVRADVTSGELYAAWDSVRDLVDGYYLSIQDNDHVPVALAFLRMVDEERRAPSSG